MTTDGRFDARLGTALKESVPVPETAQTITALASVLDRSARQRRRRRVLLPAAIAAAVVAMVGIVPWTIARFDDNATAPSVDTNEAPIVGEVWRRDVVDASEKDWRGTWTLLLKPDGALVLSSPPGLHGVGTDGNGWRIDGSTVRVDAFVGGACLDQPPGTYAWRRSGGRLVLTAIQETCQPRADVFEGSWVAVGASR